MGSEDSCDASIIERLWYVAASLRRPRLNDIVIFMYGSTKAVSLGTASKFVYENRQNYYPVFMASAITLFAHYKCREFLVCTFKMLSIYCSYLYPLNPLFLTQHGVSHQGLMKLGGCPPSNFG